jgi:hypothetical protein
LSFFEQRVLKTPLCYSIFRLKHQCREFWTLSTVTNKIILQPFSIKQNS